MNDTHIPVLLLTGYLGSGKTTLLNHILRNDRNIRFAVIVNDLGEVNIDASLIQKEGIVGSGTDDDLIALSNGCICCTLKMDLMKQLADLTTSGKFDYIVIEASGICEPAPIAQTICTLENLAQKGEGMPVPRLDAIVTVVDALRMATEFGCGDNLKNESVDEADIENLLIEQIEFCNIILLNKISEVTAEQAAHLKAIIKSLQPKARIMECDYADVPLSYLLDTGLFDFEDVATSATWVQELEHHHHEHEHHGHDHCHEEHHHHDEGEAEEYGISTWVYYRREPFDFEKFDRFVNIEWPQNIIRTKGVLYFSHNRDMSLLFDQAGSQKNLREAGLWFATAPENEIEMLKLSEPGLAQDWDPIYGDRMIKLVFIGRYIDREALQNKLDEI